jgi:methyl-accepting chemotaxis protein
MTFFNNLKIKSKIFLGFIIVLILLAAVSWIGLNGLSNLTNRIHNLEGTNELNELVLLSRQAEKNFMLRHDSNYIETLNDLNNRIIQKANETKNRFTRQEDINQMKAIIAAAELYYQAFESYTAIADKKKTLVETMHNKSENALKVCENIHNSQKTELVQIKNDNLQKMNDRLRKADDANRLIKYLLEAKAFRMVMMEGNTSVISKWQALNRKLLSLAADLKNRFTDVKNIQQVNQIIVQYKNYENAVLSYLKSRNDDEKNKLLQAANATMRIINSVRQTQKQAMSNALNEFMLHLDDKTEKADDANRLIKWFLAVRQNEKNYMMTQEKTYHLNLEKKIKQISELCKNLKTRFHNRKNIEQINEIELAVLHYKKSFEDLTRTFQQQGDALNKMLKAARNACKITEEVAKGQHDQMESELFSGRQMNILFTIIAIVMGLFFSWFIAQSISAPIATIVSFIRRIREGEVITLDIQTKEEIGEMSVGLNQMVAETQKLVNNLENLPTPIMEIDKEFNVKYMNKSGRDIVNLPMTDIVGKKCYSFFKTSHCQTSDCCCHRAMNTDQIVSDDTIADPTGLDIPIRYTGAPVKDLDGKTVGAIEFILDVSGERKINHAIIEIINGINTGDLTKRGDVTQFTGNYAELVENVNNIVESFVKPLKSIQDYVAMISRGEIPEPITEKAKGDFKDLNDHLNRCIHAVNALVKDAKNLVQASLDGQLDTRADISRHQGDFAEVVKGINDTLDAILLPIKEAQTVLENMSNGDLQKFISGDYKGDHAIIKTAINNTLSSLNDILSQVDNVSENVAASASELTSASHSLSEGAQEQAASVEEITASVHETDQQIKQNAENANMANQLVSETNQAATTGQTEMQQLSKAMEEIFEASQNISKIIKVIDEIAFQTNILALNAAVEAARAGQHGKGFAVVAQEVRNLAGRSAQAAKETAEMIEGSNKKVNEGVEFAGRTEEALKKIVENVVKVKDLVAEIATASKEQTHAMGQINEGMGQINTAVQNISSQSEETASAATQLTSQSKDLKSQLGKFQLLQKEQFFSKQTEIHQNTHSNKKQQMIPKTTSHSNTYVSSDTRQQISPKDILPLDTDERGFGEF